MNDESIDHDFEFGPFRLLPKQRLLLEGEKPVKVGSRALEILMVLVANAGRLIGKAQLMARVWPHNIVEEAALRVHIAALRKALGDGLPGRRYITTVPQRGYAFVASVRQNPPIHKPACTCGASMVRLPFEPGRADLSFIGCSSRADLEHSQTPKCEATAGLAAFPTLNRYAS